MMGNHSILIDLRSDKGGSPVRWSSPFPYLCGPVSFLVLLKLIHTDHLVQARESLRLGSMKEHPSSACPPSLPCRPPDAALLDHHNVTVDRCDHAVPLTHDDAVWHRSGDRSCEPCRLQAENTPRPLLSRLSSPSGEDLTPVTWPCNSIMSSPINLQFPQGSDQLSVSYTSRRALFMIFTPFIRPASRPS